MRHAELSRLQARLFRPMLRACSLRHPPMVQSTRWISHYPKAGESRRFLMVLSFSEEQTISPRLRVRPANFQAAPWPPLLSFRPRTADQKDPTQISRAKRDARIRRCQILEQLPK